MESSVDLGFAEICENPIFLKSKFFPSKVGGKPAWLDLSSIPQVGDLLCSQCCEPMIFLTQIYAPNEEKNECFHRTIFVFICRNKKCCEPNLPSNIKVFRNQLPRKNKFYSFDPPTESEVDIISSEKLCRICGCRGPLNCGRCKQPFYCSKTHQIVDWKHQHKIECGNQNIVDDCNKNYLFPELELTMETESFTETKFDDSEELEALRNLEYNALASDNKIGVLADLPEEEFTTYDNSSEALDKTFKNFKKRIADNPEQVIRYDRHGLPLWISNDNQLNASEIPKCTICGSERTFEFQIMPQLLNFFPNFELDWGIIAIYTCKSDCVQNDSNDYINEYVFKQDIVP